MTEKEQKKQEHYRDARITKQYDGIWQNVGKCVFCDLREKYIFYEQDGVVLTVPLYAYIDGHCMIVPRRHVRSVKELTPEEWEAVRKGLYLAKKLIRRVHGVKGMQFVQKDGASAQGTVEHIHFHCIPFDTPDLSVWSYRNLTNTPLENARLYQNRHKEIDRLAGRFEQKYKDGLP